MHRTLEQGTSQDFTRMALTANIYWEDGLYVAECAEFGTVSQGHTPAEAVDKLREATRLYLESVERPVVRPESERPNLIEGVRELEAAYARQLGEDAVEPSDIRFVEATTFTIEPSYA